MTNNKLPFLIVFYLKYFLIALVTGELLQLGWATYWDVDHYLIQHFHAHTLFRITSISTVYLLIVYAHIKETFEPAFRLVKHERFDVLAAAGFGLLFSYEAGLLGKDYYELVPTQLEIRLIVMLVSAFIGFLFIASLTTIIRACSVKDDNDVGLLLSDAPITCPEEDDLNLFPQAKNFADKIYNGGSEQSIVFGLDAPWGIGKTSFLNLMKYHWDSQYGHDHNTSEVEVFTFEPLKFGKTDNLSDRFIEEVTNTISRKFPAPELSTILGGYSRYLRRISGVSLVGFRVGFSNLDFTNGNQERLASFLRKQTLKLIVVVEDLDRLPIMEARQILYSMKSAFDLPNVSFLVCYDSQNIIDQTAIHRSSRAEVQCKDGGHALATTDGKIPDNLLEFLEKFIQVKVPVFVETEHLVKFTRIAFRRLLEGSGFGVDEELIEAIAKGIEEMLGAVPEKSNPHIFDLGSYQDQQYKYEKIIRDPRKIKRLINHLQFMGFIKNSVFERVDPKDFLNLLLLYISFPEAFRHVYQVEMGPYPGYFTDRQTEDEKPPEEKNKLFELYLESVGPTAAFLLDQIFNRHASDYSEEDEQDVQRISARYSSNLKIYLETITKQRELPAEASHKYQLKLARQMHKNLLGIDDMYDGKYYAHGDETPFKLFWLNFTKKIAEQRDEQYNRERANILIQSLIDKIPRHSALEINKIGIGLRAELPRRLLTILEAVGWDFEADLGRHNSLDNLRLVSQRILGLDAFQETGIIDTLGAPQRGVLGLYDLMLFRLSVSPDRRGNYSNLHKALAAHQGVGREIGGQAFVINSMRALSQKVFERFMETVAQKKLSLFTLIDNLSIEELSGERTSYIEEKVSEDLVSRDEINHYIASTKSTLKTFISYQLGNFRIDNGIGCGFYDLEGKADQNGINHRYNQYLFDVAFNPDTSEDAYQQFLDYLLRNTGSRFDYNTDRRLFKQDRYSLVLNAELLRAYVEQHRSALDRLLEQFAEEDRKVLLGNEDIRFKEYHSDCLAFFDELRKTDSTGS